MKADVCRAVTITHNNDDTKQSDHFIIIHTLPATYVPQYYPHPYPRGYYLSLFMDVVPPPIAHAVSLPHRQPSLEVFSTLKAHDGDMRSMRVPLAAAMV